jgi:hypothetical protein
MAMTSYEFGRQTGKLQAQIHREISEEKLKNLADALYINSTELTEFSEGYRNGFEEAKADEADDQGKLAAEAAFEEDDLPPYHCDCPGDCNHSSF